MTIITHPTPAAEPVAAPSVPDTAEQVLMALAVAHRQGYDLQTARLAAHLAASGLSPVDAAETAWYGDGCPEQMRRAGDDQAALSEQAGRVLAAADTGDVERTPEQRRLLAQWRDSQRRACALGVADEYAAEKADYWPDFDAAYKADLEDTETEVEL